MGHPVVKLFFADRAKSPDDGGEYVTYKVSQLSVSPENTVFHYVHLDLEAEGVFLAPLSPPDTPLHAELLHNFRAACQAGGDSIMIGSPPGASLWRDNAPLWQNNVSHPLSLRQG